MAWNPVKSVVNKVTSMGNSAGRKTGKFLEKYMNVAFPGLNLGTNLKNYAGQAGDAFGNYMQNVGDSLGISKYLSIPGVAEFNKGLSDYANDRKDPTAPTPDDVTDTGNAEAAAISESMSAGADTEAQEAAENTASNASAGINKARASTLGESAASGNTQQGTAATYNAQKQQTNATTNDYIQKMKQADALDSQAAYMKKGALANAAAAGLSGAANGATLGATLSDENAKQAVPSDGVDEAKLKEAISQFKSLYKQLQELKGGIE